MNTFQSQLQMERVTMMPVTPLGGGPVKSGHYPVGLAEELARRELGMEGLFQIGALALHWVEPEGFVKTVLDHAVQSLQSDAGLIFLRDQDGNFTPKQQGHPALLNQLLTLLPDSVDALMRTGGRQTLALTGSGHPFAALAALIPGVGTAMGILCLGRHARSGPFLPDEKEFLLGYARTASLALQKIVLRENLERTLIDAMASFVAALESKDVFLNGHSARVARYAGEIATVMALSPAQVLVTRRAGMLHDLGKLAMLDSILHKPDRLTGEERALMMRHPSIGEKILRPLQFLCEEARAVRHHHERYDGEGYPDALRGEEIPLPARIVTVADAFDAMTSNRPYRDALPFEAALSEIRRCAKTQFDPSVAEAFASIPRSRLSEIGRYDGTRPSPVPERQASGSLNAPVATAA